MRKDGGLNPFASLVKFYRKEKKITAEELADKIKIDRTYISKIENGSFLPSYEIACNIASILEKKGGMLRAYMIAKYPKAVEHFDKLARSKETFSKNIIELLEYGRSELDIIAEFKDNLGDRKENAAEYVKLMKIIKKFKDALNDARELEKVFQSKIDNPPQ